jgi:hypothetical protein
MKKIYYEKVGRRYVPVSEYDNDFLDSFTKGNHLVMSYPGGTSRRYNVDPNYAAMIAAGRVAEDVISKRLHEATEIRRNYKNRQTPLTPGQLAAWNKLIEEMGEDARQLEWPSVRECAEAGVRAMQEEADKLMKHASVRAAYEQFQLVCMLAKEAGDAETR